MHDVIHIDHKARAEFELFKGVVLSFREELEQAKSAFLDVGVLVAFTDKNEMTITGYWLKGHQNLFKIVLQNTKETSGCKLKLASLTVRPMYSDICGYSELKLALYRASINHGIESLRHALYALEIKP